LAQLPELLSELFARFLDELIEFGPLHKRHRHGLDPFPQFWKLDHQSGRRKARPDPAATPLVTSNRPILRTLKGCFKIGTSEQIKMTNERISL
jgi:hypothetical protein